MLIELRTLMRVLSNGELGEILHELRRRLWSTEVSFCLRRDLEEPFDAPRARVPFTIHKLLAEDHREVLRERPRRLPMLQRNVPTCYVARGEEGQLCYMQWLIGPASNEHVKQVFGGCVPPLASNVALMEFAYTFVDWRGKNIMPRAMALIAEKASELGCRYVITFVREENVPALKGCHRAGFRMYRRQSVTWRLFRRVNVDTKDLPPGTPYSFEKVQQIALPEMAVTSSVQ